MESHAHWHEHTERDVINKTNTLMQLHLKLVSSIRQSEDDTLARIPDPINITVFNFLVVHETIQVSLLMDMVCKYMIAVNLFF